MNMMSYKTHLCHTHAGVNEQYDPSEEERRIHEQLVNSAWCGLLAALTILLEACTDEAATENILKAIQVCLLLHSNFFVYFLIVTILRGEFANILEIS